MRTEDGDTTATMHQSVVEEVGIYVLGGGGIDR